MSKSPSLRRIKADIRELSIDPSDQYHAAPLEHDMFEWHFTIRGAPDTDFAGGIYHGRILLPPEYPFKPPNIVFLTPSGRFECGVKVCLSFSAHHPELWQPAWGIRLILEALISFLPTPADGAIGALDWTPEERRKLARESVKFRCPVCCEEGETCADLLPKLKAKGEKKKGKFQEEIEKLKMLQFQNHAVEDTTMKVDSEKKGDPAKSESGGPTEAEGAEEGGGPPAQYDGDTSGAAAKPPPDVVREPTPEPAEDEVAKMLPAAPDAPPPPAPPRPRAIDEGDATMGPADPPVPPPAVQANDAALAAAPAPPAVANGYNNNNENAPVVSDGLLNILIGFFGVVVMVLLREAQELVDELQGLEVDD